MSTKSSDETEAKNYKQGYKQGYAKKIDTPDETEANYVYEDFAGNPVYFDGSEYWVIDRGEVCNYG